MKDRVASIAILVSEEDYLDYCDYGEIEPTESGFDEYARESMLDYLSETYTPNFISVTVE